MAFYKVPGGGGSFWFVSMNWRHCWHLLGGRGERDKCLAMQSVQFSTKKNCSYIFKVTIPSSPGTCLTGSQYKFKILTLRRWPLPWDSSFYIYIYIYIYTHTHTYIHIYINTHTHTHTHTHTYIYIFFFPKASHVSEIFLGPRRK